MKLDEDLRQSYKYGNHDSLSFGKKKKKKRVEVAVLCKKCEKYIDNRRKALTKSVEKNFIAINKSKTIYDEEEIDYINEHQTRIYISFVDINPFVKYGIRAHYD